MCVFYYYYIIHNESFDTFVVIFCLNWLLYGTRLVHVFLQTRIEKLYN